jgi:hypothetical protein
VEALIAAISDVLVDVPRVNVASVSQRNTVFPGPHRVLVQVGDTIGRTLPQVAKGQVGHRDTLDYVGSHDLLGRFGSNVGVEHPGSVGELYIHQGFGEAQAQATYLADLGVYPVPL